MRPSYARARAWAAGPAAPDLRMAAVAGGVWAGTLTGQGSTTLLATVSACLGVVVLGVVAGLVRPGGTGRRSGHRSGDRLLVLAVCLGFVAAGQVAAIRADQAGRGIVADLAERRSSVTVEGMVTSDARPVDGGWGERTAWRLSTVAVTHGAGVPRVHTVRRPVLVISDGTAGPALGSTVRVAGRLGPLTEGEIGVLLAAGGVVETLEDPGIWWRASEALRGSIRDAVRDRPPVPRSLVPALVDGDDVAIPETVAEDFRETGLTHLLAVSGTNLTLMVGFLLGLARWAGVRGHGTTVVGLLGIAGFILLARTEPSVLRAAVMGVVGLVGLGPRGGVRGIRILAAAVVVLLMLDPGLARSAGFVLSVLATGGILVLAAPLRDAMVVWMPRWLAEAIAVPFAAQLACTPVVAAISGRVSLVAVAANMLAAPAVGPATVLGLAGGVLGLLHDPLGRVPGTMASWCVAWIATVAERGADLPTAAIAWSESWPGIAALSLVAAVTAIGSLRVVRHRGPTIALTGVLVAVVLVRPGGLLPGGWLPDDWVVVACDVGQGDAVAVRAGPEAAVVVDAGPDPTLVDRCLAEIGVNAVPLLVLTHFHADHVDGLDGVLAGRRVGAVEVTTTLDPPGGVRDVLGVAEERRVAPAYAAAGPARVFGTATVQALWPPAGAPRPGPGDGSAANDASVVLLVEVEGIRILLTGDVEPLSQGRLARAYPGLRVDVLKMPHHGSRYQDLDWLASLGAETVLVSVGADNDYGHPAADALAALSWAGSEVFRTDRSGHLAVVVREGRPRVVAQR